MERHAPFSVLGRLAIFALVQCCCCKAVATINSSCLTTDDSTSLLSFKHCSIQPDGVTFQNPSSEPYNLMHGTEQACYGQWGQDVVVAPLLSEIKNGFFLEAGAYDGESGSNTLLYELKGWKGLLVEPDPSNFKKLMAKKRRAYAFNGALSTTGKQQMLNFGGHGEGAKLGNSGSTEVLAVPLSELLQAVNQSSIDLLSLDVEGSEGSILENTDFSKVDIGVLIIEMNKNKENNDRVNAVMAKGGFIDIGRSFCTVGKEWMVLDRVFANPNYFEKRGLQVPTNLPRKVPGCCQASNAASVCAAEEGHVVAALPGDWRNA